MLCPSHLQPRPPKPRRRVGDSRRKVLCFYFSIVSAVPRKYQGFVLYRQIWQCNKNITDCWGKGPWFYQLGVPTAVICWTKVKVSAIPRGLGGVVTNDWYITQRYGACRFIINILVNLIIKHISQGKAHIRVSKFFSAFVSITG